MANGNLIQGARRLGQSKRFVDYGKVLGEAMKPTQGMLLAKQQYFQAVKEKEAKTQNFIDNLSDLDITKIPTGLRDQVTDFLTTGRQKYYDASERAANARMGSEEYRNAVREMNTINNSFRNLSGRLENLQQARTEFIQNYDQGMVSKGNQNYDEALSILGADLNDPNALNLSISESGDIGFIIKGADGQDKIVNEIPNYFNKASNVSNSLAKMSETYNINGQKGIEVTDQILRDNVYRTIGDNRDNIVSLATDSWLGAPALINESNIDTELYQGLTGAELLDPANQAALKSYVNDRYYNGIKDAYSSGYGVYNKRKDEAANAERRKEENNLNSLLEEIASKSIVEGGLQTVDPLTITLPEGQENFFSQNEPIYRDVEGVNEQASQEKYAFGLADTLNSNVYGSQDRFYLSRAQLVAKLRGKPEFASDLPGEQGRKATDLKIMRHINEKYGEDIYLFSTTESDKGTPVGIPTDYKNPKSARITTLFNAAGVDPNL